MEDFSFLLTAHQKLPSTPRSHLQLLVIWDFLQANERERDSNKMGATIWQTHTSLCPTTICNHVVWLQTSLRLCTLKGRGLCQGTDIRDCGQHPRVLQRPALDSRTMEERIQISEDNQLSASTTLCCNGKLLCGKLTLYFNLMVNFWSRFYFKKYLFIYFIWLYQVLVAAPEIFFFFFCSCSSSNNNLPATQERWIWSLSWEDPLEKVMATHSSILAWEIPCTVQYMGSQRVGHNRVFHAESLVAACEI